ncbi:hypothetical protein FZEAL_5112 [Fusarium zealandicum]|uniref:Methyltransferase n=1 Tax=Fusarium zealandicum TaxID=1053134 RepID=A0A8H4XK58_9HYPO|nr:hypothetical protein FZEAL_5112 [Fusarium zealandicum]
MQDDDGCSFSLISTADNDSVYTPTDQDTDEFELVYDDDRSDCSPWAPSSSCSTSVPPSIYGDEHEHGRCYHSFKSGRYPLPNDDGEQRREDTEHAVMLHLLKGKLFVSDVGDNPQKIIDVGTGTVADLYPSASVIGTDLSPIQPRWMPINAQFFVEDCEDPVWTNGNDFDLVHFRGLAGFLLDLEGMVINARNHLRCGGWIEFQEYDHAILCDDGTMQTDDPLRAFFDTCAQGMREYGCLGFGKQDIRQTLKNSGFKRVQVVSKKVPISTWPRDEKMKTLGTLMRANILEMLDAMAAKPLVALGMTPEQRHDMVDGVRKSLQDVRVHRYMNCSFYFGQKGEADSCLE